MDKFKINPQEGDRIIDQYGVLWIYDSRSKSWIDMGFLDVYGNVSREENGLVYPSLFSLLESLDPDKFNSLKIVDNIKASFYYFYSSDHTIKFKLEEHLGESKLRAEIVQGALAKKFREFRCQGPKGTQGDKGITGIPGIPANNEPTNNLNINNGLIQIEVNVATPLNTAISLRLFRNSQQIGEFLIYEDGEVAMNFVDGYSIKEGTTYNIYMYENVLYATFELDGDFSGIWTYKARQTGPDGMAGKDGDWFLLLKETEIPEDLLSDQAIFQIGKSGPNISYVISAISDQVCAVGIITADPSIFKFNLYSTQFISAQYMIDNCRNIYEWQYEKPALTILDLDMPQWTPTECCPKTRVSE